jgi:hypothetical protein
MAEEKKRWSRKGFGPEGTLLRCRRQVGALRILRLGDPKAGIYKSELLVAEATRIFHPVNAEGSRFRLGWITQSRFWPKCVDAKLRSDLFEQEKDYTLKEVTC